MKELIARRKTGHTVPKWGGRGLSSLHPLYIGVYIKKILRNVQTIKRKIQKMGRLVVNWEFFSYKTHRHERFVVPCSGRMRTLNSSSWLREQMRSSSSWMAWGQSVISWRHALTKTAAIRDAISNITLPERWPGRWPCRIQEKVWNSA